MNGLYNEKEARRSQEVHDFVMYLGRTNGLRSMLFGGKVTIATHGENNTAKSIEGDVNSTEYETDTSTYD